jgi:hypothetical protein
LPESDEGSDDAGSVASDDRVAEADVWQFLERLGQALSSGEVEGVSRCWLCPALVLSETASPTPRAIGKLAAGMRRLVS